MDFTAPSFSLGIDFDDPPPAAAARTEPDRRQARGYAAPDAPSFSLGLDFEGDRSGGDEPQLPAGGRSEGLARRYEAPDAPSFSLGFDDDDGGASEPELPAGGRREEQARCYEVPDPPSFSLGFEEDGGGGAGEPQFPAGGRRVEQARRYEAPDPPSFSLGFDDDDGGGGGAGEPHLPARSCREEQPRRYEAPDAPSFSLGFDEEEDDFVAAGGRLHEQPRTQVAPGHLSCLDDEDEEFLLFGCRRPDRARGEALHPDPVQPETSRLKRLRRGPAPQPMAPPAPPPPPSASAPLTTETSPGTAVWGDIGSIEDEIEGSTDDEQLRGMAPSVGSCRTSSNSKFSLLSQSVLTTQSTRKAKITKCTPSSSSVLSKPLEESCTKKLLPKITISPLRKIHFLDSDTDSDDNKSRNKAKKPVSPIKKRQASMDKYVQKKHNSKSEGSSVAQKNKDNTNDSWATPALDDFCSEYVQKKHTLQKNSKSEGSSVVQKNKDNMNDSWATPALDDFCSEYFQSVQDSRPSQQKEVNRLSGSKVPRPYNSVSEIGEHFQHESSSSRAVPEENLTDSHPPAMHYFFHHDKMIQKLVRERLQHFVPIGAETSQGNEYGVEENLNYRNHFGQSGDANGRWVTPNQTTSFPTDFGKRRVHASGTQSGSGHWFTGEDGRKVYVSKNGQELSGRGAYRQYRKESGKGFRKFKKKGSAGARRGSTAATKASSSAKRSSAAKRKR
ncbi:unnamed protein product [Alopecurus aequalis]